MIISVTCPNCGTRLRAGDNMVGREARCPSCDQVLTVAPDPPGGPAGRRRAAATKTAEPESKTATPPKDAGRPTGGIDESTAYRYAVPMLKLYEQEEGARSFGSIGGYELTATRLVLLAMAIAVVSGLGAWLYVIMRPAARAGGIQIVQAYTALANVLVVDADHPGAADAQTHAASAEHFYTVGGEDQLSVIRPDPQGDFLMMRVVLSRDAVIRHAAISRTGTILHAKQFELRGGQAPAVPRFLVEDVGRSVRFDLSRAATRDGWAVLPLNAISSDEKPNSAGGAAVTFDGSDGVSGGVTFRLAHTGMGQPTGLLANGKLDVVTSGATTLQYDYRGEVMTISWDASSTGWRSVEQYHGPRASQLPAQTTLVLLMPRPVKLGLLDLELHLDGESILVIPGTWAREGSRQ